MAPRSPKAARKPRPPLEYDPSPRLVFLHHVAEDISCPIARDDRVHIEYVPTQVVTEYLLTVTTVDGRREFATRVLASVVAAR